MIKPLLSRSRGGFPFEREVLPLCDSGDFSHNNSENEFNVLYAACIKFPESPAKSQAFQLQGREEGEWEGKLRAVLGAGTEHWEQQDFQ